MSRKVCSNYMSKNMTNIGDTAEAITHCSGCSCIRRIYKIHTILVGTIYFSHSDKLSTDISRSKIL